MNHVHCISSNIKHFRSFVFKSCNLIIFFLYHLQFRALAIVKRDKFNTINMGYKRSKLNLTIRHLSVTFCTTRATNKFATVRKKEREKKKSLCKKKKIKKKSIKIKNDQSKVKRALRDKRKKENFQTTFQDSGFRIMDSG